MSFVTERVSDLLSKVDTGFKLDTLSEWEPFSKLATSEPPKPLSEDRPIVEIEALRRRPPFEHQAKVLFKALASPIISSINTRKTTATTTATTKPCLPSPHELDLLCSQVYDALHKPSKTTPSTANLHSIKGLSKEDENRANIVLKAEALFLSKVVVTQLGILLDRLMNGYTKLATDIYYWKQCESSSAATILYFIESK